MKGSKWIKGMLLMAFIASVGVLAGCYYVEHVHHDYYDDYDYHHYGYHHHCY